MEDNTRPRQTETPAAVRPARPTRQASSGAGRSFPGEAAVRRIGWLFSCFETLRRAPGSHCGHDSVCGNGCCVAAQENAFRERNRSGLARSSASVNGRRGSLTPEGGAPGPE